MFTSSAVKLAVASLAVAALGAFVPGVATAAFVPVGSCGYEIGTPARFDGPNNTAVVKAPVTHTCANGVQGRGFFEYRVDLAHPAGNRITFSESLTDRFRAVLYTHPRYRSGFYRTCLNIQPPIGAGYTQCTEETYISL